LSKELSPDTHRGRNASRRLVLFPGIRHFNNVYQGVVAWAVVKRAVGAGIIRGRACHTRERFSWETETARSFIYQIERGQGNPSIRTLIKMARVLGCKVQDFIRF
jgi:DNA-binding XRE family transcriptional regulator